MSLHPESARPDVNSPASSANSPPDPVVQPLHTDAGRWLKRGMALVLLGFGGALLWAGLAPLDKGVAVSGKVIVTDNRKVVQPAAAGRVAHLYVREGDSVQRGQVLAELDVTPAKTQRDNLRIQLLEAQLREARLRAERDDQSVLPTPDPALLAAAAGDELPPLTTQQIQLGQQQLFLSRRAALRQEIAAMRSAIDGSRAQQQGTRALLESYRIQSRLLGEQLGSLRPLAAEGYIPRNRLLETERQAAQLHGDIARQSGALAQTGQQIAELEQKILQRQEEYQKEVRTQLTEVQLSIQDLAQRLTAAQYELQNTRILAPVSGSVVGLTLHTEGGVVSNGQTLMEVVPAGQPLQVDAQLPIDLVDRIAPGLPVELMFSAFNQSTTPRVSGSVALVGADQLIDPLTNLPYYPLRINVDEQGKRQLSGLDIRPGMPVEAFVRTGERSLFNYLFKPLADRLHIALTEE
ncbi:HlyD family type I secretion periplasmic adaptor subunit [Brenneria populi]|uniref:Membrane fusion protein (MFP) family protein n=1 Tax=Brenneria populi TaxID=1505588 RepID=A0ABU6JVW9_9GAMM|nr:HlyD family type I secretion periplasmic adaptor subunit [Brenneria populi Li et al. 2015]